MIVVFGAISAAYLRHHFASIPFAFSCGSPAEGWKSPDSICLFAPAAFSSLWVQWSAVFCGALEDSRTPLILITIGCVINISTDLLFVGGLRTGPTEPLFPPSLLKLSAFAGSIIFGQRPAAEISPQRTLFSVVRPRAYWRRGFPLLYRKALSTSLFDSHCHG